MAVPVEDASPVRRLSPFTHPHRRAPKPNPLPDSPANSAVNVSTWSPTGPLTPEPEPLGSHQLDIRPDGTLEGFELELEENRVQLWPQPVFLSPPPVHTSALLPFFPGVNFPSGQQHTTPSSEERLKLVLKPQSLLSRSGGQAGVSCRLDVDPNPDWDLSDLSAEIDKIVHKNGTTPSPLRVGDNRGNVRGGHRLTCIGLLEPTDFGRPKAPFVVRVPDFDDDEEENAAAGPSRTVEQSRQRSPEGARPADDVAVPSGRSWEESLLPPPDVVEAALFELEKERLARVKEDIRARWRDLTRDAEAQGRREAEAIEALEKERKRALERTRARDAEDQRGIAEAREAALRTLQRDHEEREAASRRRLKDAELAAREAAEAKVKRRQEEEEARRQQELRERQAEEHRRKAEAERAETERKRNEVETERKRIESETERNRNEVETERSRNEAERKRIEVERAETERKRIEAERNETERTRAEEQRTATNLSASGGKVVRVAESAARGEAERLEVLRTVKASVKAFEDAASAKKERKTLERRMTTLVQQISATQRQVALKSGELIRELTSAQQPQRNYLMLALADKFLSQCESQVQKLPSFAFPLAHVAVNVAADVAPFRDVLLARLGQECCYVIPKYVPYIPAQYESEAAYYREIGYREEDGRLESTDAYIGRLTGIIVFYAAIMQTDLPRGQPVHGLDQAWAWLARLLNGLPPNRGSGTALESMIKVAGYRLHQSYPKQFQKILNLVMTSFLPALKTVGDADTAPVINRIETYVGTRGYQKIPEGRNMPVTDESATLGGVDDAWDKDRRGYR